MYICIYIYIYIYLVYLYIYIVSVMRLCTYIYIYTHMHTHMVFRFPESCSYHLCRDTLVVSKAAHFKQSKVGISNSKHPLYKKKYQPIPGGDDPEGADDLSQSDAARHLPPGASIWRGNKRGNWNGHFAPFPRVSAAWSRFGNNSRLALENVLQTLWRQFFELHNLPANECPYPQYMKDES